MRKGLTLVEVVVAVALMALTGCLVYPMFTSGKQLEFATKSHVLATYFARETMERLRIREPSKLEPGRWVDPIDASHPFSKDQNALREYAIETKTEGSSIIGYIAKVTVSWDTLELAPGTRNQIQLVLFRTSAQPLGLTP